MNYIFINRFNNQVHIFENTDLRKCFAYKDNSFLNDYDEFKIFVISKDLSLVTSYENNCITDWFDQFERNQNVQGKFYMWFMSNDMKFSSCGNSDEAQISFEYKQDTHIFIGGSIDGGHLCYSYIEFYQYLISLYCCKANTFQDKLVQDVAEVKEILLSLKEQIELSNNNKSNGEEADKEIQDLKEELSKYRNDFYFKSVQRQGMDAMLEVLDSMCTLLHNSRNKSQEVIDSIEYGIKLIERALQKSFKIKFISSKVGDHYNEETMIAYPTDSVATNDQNLSGCVAKSLSPAIYWTLPRVNSTDLEFLYKEESVILYI